MNKRETFMHTVFSTNRKSRTPEYVPEILEGPMEDALRVTDDRTSLSSDPPASEPINALPFA